MTIVKTPSRIQPAFNEVTVTDDTATSLHVSSLAPAPIETATLHHLNVNGGATFDLKGFVSKLFYDDRTPIATPNFAPWAFQDHRLAVGYKFGGDDTQYMALNAVRQPGESLDIAAESAMPVLSERAKTGRTPIEIPCYDGYPVGFSAVWRNAYELDTSDAFIVTLDAVAGVEYLFPIHGDGLITWGDGSTDSAPTTATLYKGHIYAESGIKTIMCIPTGGAILLDEGMLGTSIPAIQQYRSRIRTVEQFSTQMPVAKFIRCTGLQYVNAPWRTFSCNPASMFRECSDLRGIVDDFFGSVTSASLSNCSGVFYGCRRLTAVPTDFFTGAAAYSISFASCFYGCTGLTSIPVGMLPTNATSGGVNVDSMFQGCTSLTSIPGDLFHPLGGKERGFTNTFYGCSQLTTLPTTLFHWSTSATSFTSTFEGCTRLTGFHSNTFRHNEAVTSFNRTFYGCTGLTDIPAGAFERNGLVTSFSQTFQGCTDLTGIPQRVFDGATAVTTVQSCFRGCVKLTTIPPMLFASNPAIRMFGGTFRECGVLSTVAGDIFSHTTVAGVNVSACFYDCIKLAAIPPSLMTTNISDLTELFRGCVALTSIPSGFFAPYTGSGITPKCAYMFDGCTGTTSIPATLLHPLTGATTQFEYMFYGLRVATIPSGLLQHNAAITSAASMFSSNSELASIPGDLFDSCIELTNVSGCFSMGGASKISAIPSNLFAKNKKITNFASCFYAAGSIITGATPATEEGYKFWERAGKPGYPATITGTSCFRNRTGLSDYASIPATWK